MKVTSPPIRTLEYENGRLFVNKFWVNNEGIVYTGEENSILHPCGRMYALALQVGHFYGENAPMICGKCGESALHVIPTLSAVVIKCSRCSTSIEWRE